MVMMVMMVMMVIFVMMVILSLSLWSNWSRWAHLLLYNLPKIAGKKEILIAVSVFSSSVSVSVFFMRKWFWKIMITNITCNEVHGVWLLRGDTDGAIETWLDSVSIFFLKQLKVHLWSSTHHLRKCSSWIQNSSISRQWSRCTCYALTSASSLPPSTPLRSPQPWLTNTSTSSDISKYLEKRGFPNSLDQQKCHRPKCHRAPRF